MGRKPLGWSAIILGIGGVALFAILIVVTVLARGSVRDWAGEYLDPADQALGRLSKRLVRTDDRTEAAEEAVADLIATGADRIIELTRTEITRLQLDLLALEASVLSVDSGMEIISALPFFDDERRGFKEAVALQLAGLRDKLTSVDARLIDARALAEEIRRGGDAAERARIALEALAQEIAPTISAVQSFLNELGLALVEVRTNLNDASIRVDHVLTTATVVLSFIFAWLAIAHYCVYLAGKRLLEEEVQLGSERNPSPAE